MERKDLMKKFVKKELGQKLYDTMLITIIYREALLKLLECDQETVDEMLNDIQTDISLVAEEFFTLNQGMPYKVQSTLENLYHDWEVLTTLSEESADILLSYNIKDDFYAYSLFNSDHEKTPF